MSRDSGQHEVPFSEEHRIIEALLFAADDVVSPAKLKSILPGKPDARQIKQWIGDINRMLQQQRHPFDIAEVAGGYQFRTVPYYHQWIGRLLTDKGIKKLSLQALECLAIIAYRQPLTKAEIESVRGVISDGAMKTLLERKLITVTGRSDGVGKPLLYGTTREFLLYFGLHALSELPKLEEFEELARERMNEELHNEPTDESSSYAEEEQQNPTNSKEELPVKETTSPGTDSTSDSQTENST